MDIEELSAHITEQVWKGEGGSYSLNYEEPTTGYFVGGRTWTMVVTQDEFQPYHAFHFLTANRSILSWSEMFVGWWAHEGKVYLDVSEHFNDKQDAINEGVYRRELAIWDVAKGEEIKTK